MVGRRVIKTLLPDPMVLLFTVADGAKPFPSYSETQNNNWQLSLLALLSFSASTLLHFMARHVLPSRPFRTSYRISACGGARTCPASMAAEVTPSPAVRGHQFKDPLSQIFAWKCNTSLLQSIVKKEVAFQTHLGTLTPKRMFPPALSEHWE
jgi:hypothetical protein